MPLDETARRVIEQFLQARLLSAQASLEAAQSLSSPTLPTESTANFMLVASLFRRWHNLDTAALASREHRGKLLMDYFRDSSQFTLSRQRKLPLLMGDEVLQTKLVTDLWSEFFFTIRLIPIKISQRGDRLNISFTYRKLPRQFHQIFSQRDPTNWLMQNLTLENFTAWLWRQEFIRAGVTPHARLSQPYRFSLSFAIVTQMTLPLDSLVSGRSALPKMIE